MSHTGCSNEATLDSFVANRTSSWLPGTKRRVSHGSVGRCPGAHTALRSTHRGSRLKDEGTPPQHDVFQREVASLLIETGQ
ncbi:unnamed protein product [Pleuronectes platessa]|uniref:Uncharacterized protein n=1 Tax=Pleuronectes platessa TaxID=8262 RepID=A0A9N7VHH6_PLEPL|nr:unnamed protein product [Pleuronectes platessa]